MLVPLVTSSTISRFCFFPAVADIMREAASGPPAKARWMLRRKISLSVGKVHLFVVIPCRVGADMASDHSSESVPQM